MRLHDAGTSTDTREGDGCQYGVGLGHAGDDACGEDGCGKPLWACQWRAARAEITSLGGTLAELANYIQSRGGIVHGVFVLVNAGRSKSLSPDKRTLKTLESRFAHELIEIFGIAVNAHTANEARYLVGFRTADAIRNRLAKAKQEIDLRLRSKGISSVFGG